MLLFQKFLRKILQFWGTGTAICYSSPRVSVVGLPSSSLQRLGVSRLVQTNWNSVLVDLSRCYAEGSNKEERCKGYNTQLHKTFWNAVNVIFCVVALTLDERSFFHTECYSWKWRNLSAMLGVQRSFTTNLGHAAVCPSAPNFSGCCLMSNETS